MSFQISIRQKSRCHSLESSTNNWQINAIYGDMIPWDTLTGCFPAGIYSDVTGNMSHRDSVTVFLNFDLKLRTQISKLCEKNDINIRIFFTTNRYLGAFTIYIDKL